MRTAAEIVEDVKSGIDTKNYNLLETHLHLCIEQILNMYANRQISKEEANKRKMLATKKYEDSKKQYEFESSMFKEHIKVINETCGLRMELRKKWKDETAEINEQRFAELLNLAMEILSKTFKGEF